MQVEKDYKPDRGALRADVGPLTQDPTALTTQQLLRENFWLRELTEAKITQLEQRMEASDKAVDLLQQFTNRTPTTKDIQHEVMALREVMVEKFQGIDTQLRERDVQTDKASRDVKSAVDAAFAAAKEAVGEQNKSNALAIAKSEAGFTKQIDSLAEQNKTNMRGVDDKFGDIKERLTVIESKTSISDPSTAVNLAKLQAAVDRLSSSAASADGRSSGMTAMWGFIGGAVGLVVGIIVAAAALVKMGVAN